MLYKPRAHDAAHRFRATWGVILRLGEAIDRLNVRAHHADVDGFGIDRRAPPLSGIVGANN